MKRPDGPVVSYALALQVCLTLRHPLFAILPELADAPDSDAVAHVLVANREKVERFYLAESV